MVLCKFCALGKCKYGESFSPVECTSNLIKKSTSCVTDLTVADDNRINKRLVENPSASSVSSTNYSEPADDISGSEEIDKAVMFGVDDLKCMTYNFENNRTVTIDDSNQILSSSKTFHSKYIVETDIFQNKYTNVFRGKNKFSQVEVAIKRFMVGDYRDDLVGNVPKEVFYQQKAEQVNIQNGKGTVLKVFDWYVYDKYFVIVTEYDENFRCLFNCVEDEDDKHLNEEECKIIFKLLFELVFELNKLGIFHMDLKAENVLYNREVNEIKLIDFGLALSDDPGENPELYGVCGTPGLETPEQVKEEDYYGKDVDMWGIAQTIFFCLQGYYPFKNNTDVKKWELKFRVEVSEDCKDLFTRMLSENVEDRMTPQEIRDHPWLKED